MYRLDLTPDARRDLRRLDAVIRRRVFEKLNELCETCETMPYKALKGKHKGKFSIRFAKNYRIIYTFDRQRQTIEVFRIRHRSICYKILML